MTIFKKFPARLCPTAAKKGGDLGVVYPGGGAFDFVPSRSWSNTRCKQAAEMDKVSGFSQRLRPHPVPSSPYQM